MRRFSRSGSNAEEVERLSIDIMIERLKEGKSIAFKVKYEGCYPVTEARGVASVRQAFKELKREKEERRRRGQKHSPFKEFAISLDCAQIKDLDTMEAEETYPIRSISYIVNDERNRSYIGMIAQGRNSGFRCVILKQDEGRARDVVQALGQAFDLAYQKFLKSDGRARSAAKRKQITESSQSKAKSDEADEISILRLRLRDLAVLVPPEKLELYLRKQRISEITEMPDSEKDEKESSAPDGNKPLPVVGRQLQNLIWDEVDDEKAPLSTTEREDGKSGSSEIPRVNPPPASRGRRPRAFSALEDPFAMGDFTALEFETFDQRIEGYGDIVIPKSMTTANDLLS